MTHKLTAIAAVTTLALSALAILAVSAHADDEEEDNGQDLGNAAHNATNSLEQAGLVTQEQDTADVPLLLGNEDEDEDDDGDG